MAPASAGNHDGSALECRGVTYRLPSGTPLVCGLNLRVAEGETVVLLGRSGSGKTTTLKLINRLLEPNEGEIFISGRTASSWDPIQLRRGIGYVIQDVGLFPHWSVEKNVALVPQLDRWPEDRIRARVKEMLELVGLPPAEFASRRPSELSGGQRQRVGVARALAADPPILLMDEPFGALDPVTRAELQREFSALARRLGKTIVFVTHDLHDALLLPTPIVLLQTARLVSSSTPHKFLRLDHPPVRTSTSSLTASPGIPASASQSA